MSVRVDGDLAFVDGLVGEGGGRRRLEDSFEGQFEQAIDNLGRLLGGLGSGLKQVVWAEVRYVGSEHLEALDRIYGARFAPTLPARTSYMVPGLAGGALVQVGGTAAIAAPAAMPPSIVVESAPTPVGAYPHARAYNGYVWLTAQAPRDPLTGRLVRGGIDAQLERAIANLELVLKACSSELGRVLRARVMHVEPAHRTRIVRSLNRHFDTGAALLEGSHSVPGMSSFR